FGELTGDESEHHGFVFWHQPQRFESSSTRSVVLQKVGVDVDPVEQGIGDQVVAAFGAPMTLIVAPANVHREMQSGWTSSKRTVHHVRIGIEQQRSRVVATLSHRLPDSRVAQ